MSRFNKKAILAAAGLAMTMTGAAYGQLTVTEPVINNNEYVGDTTRIVLSVGGANAETITSVSAEVQLVLDTGASNAVGAPVALPVGALFDEDLGVEDFTVDGGLFTFDADPDVLIVDMQRAIAGSPQLATNLSNAVAQIGMGDGFGATVQYVVIRFEVATDGPQTLTTQSPVNGVDIPVAASSANGGLDAGVSFVHARALLTSPQYVPAPTLNEVTVSAAANPIVNYIYDRVLNTGNATNDVNQFILADIDENDISRGGAALPGADFNAVAFGPSNDVLRVTLNMGAATTGQVFGFESVLEAMDNRASARDYLGYTLVGDTATAANALALALTGATFTAGSLPGDDTAVLQLQFNQPLNGAGTADSYDITLNGTALVAGTAASFGVPAIDPMDSTRATIAVDFGALGVQETGVAPNGRALDLNAAADADAIGVNDHTQLPFFVTLTDGGTTPPSDALGTPFVGTFTDTNPVADGIAPQLLATATLDTNGDGLIDGVGLVFDEEMADSAGTGSTISALDASNVTDISALDADGTLPAAAAITFTTPAAGDQALPAVDPALGFVDPNPAFPGTTALETNNSLRFEGLDLSVFASNTQPVPSTGDTANFEFAYDQATGDITDAAGNAFTPGGGFSADATTDRAAPALLEVRTLTGDNQTAAGNDQLVVEQDGAIGDAPNNNRFVFVFSEDLDNNTPDETGLTIDGTTFDTSDDDGGLFANGTTENIFTIINDESVAGGVGSTVALAGTGVDDASDNEAAGSAVASNAVAPYISLIEDGGAVPSAFLIDDDGDGFADSIFLQFTENVRQSDLALADFQSFGANAGTITGVDTLTGTDNSIVVLTVTDGEIAVGSPSDVRYVGTTAVSLIRGSATGNTVAAVDTAFQARAISDPQTNTQAPDVMIIAGTLAGEDGVTGAPIGTRVYASVAIPTINRISADFNGIEFEYLIADGDFPGEPFDAFNNVFHGLSDFLYVQRGAANALYFTNTTEHIEGALDFDFITDTIDISLNTRNLANITFSGQGETNQDDVDGTVGLAWDFFRGDNQVADFVDNGFDVFDTEFIFSETVITEADGRYELYVSSLGGAFIDSPIAGLDLPVIVWCELPTGERFVLSSLTRSASTNDFDGDGAIGDAVIFSPNNLRQESSGAASSGTNINFSLANVGSAQIFEGWNMVPFARNGGVAASSRDVPTLPNGVSESAVTIANVLAASPVDQFGFWNDDNGDGMWTAADDNSDEFDGLFVDFDLVEHFSFTLSTNGLQIGSGIDSLVGGYGVGIFNIDDETYGAFQFGSALPAGAVFVGNPVTGSVANATQGWLLVTTSQAASPANNFFAQNAGTDFIISFQTEGPGDVIVGSLSPSTDAGNPNDLEEVGAGEALFIHYDN